eukprot:CAMPEP_0171128160 /NCGR_PEP_ID=MMETSP0766_2-20121228/116555_1 /TAXON_ID=439317 /ORGANISM="Gambierdiscus australes, Strain CAWD 149" /LENGTH=68 /DNA_ID=CAMNT_0011591305 /DNA_START=21 /DNA_END=227 /DNA_ORIENTATION=+
MAEASCIMSAKLRLWLSADSSSKVNSPRSGRACSQPKAEAWGWPGPNGSNTRGSMLPKASTAYSPTSS